MNKKGQALVEIAIMLPILVLFVFGITEFGRAMYIKNCLNNAARAGVRQAVVTSGLTNNIAITSTNDQGFPDIQSKIYDSIFYMKKADVTALVTYTPNTHSPAQASDTVTVTVTLTGFASFVPKLIKIGNTLIGSASMRYE